MSKHSTLLIGLLWWISFIIFILIPSIFSIIYSDKEKFFYSNREIFSVLGEHLIIFSFILILFIIINKIKYGWLQKIVILASALNYGIIYFIIAYGIYTGFLLDLSLFDDYRADIIKTGLSMFGGKFFLLNFLLLLVTSIFYLIFNNLSKSLKRIAAIDISRTSTSMLIVAVIFILYFVPQSIAVVVRQYLYFDKANAVKIAFSPFFPNNAMYRSESDENIFILQLESGNGLALNQNFMPRLYEIAKKDGIIFPLFWSNSVQTNRAQENILCGINNNIGQSFSLRPADIKTNCLPKILKKNGWKTLMFYADDLTYVNTGNFMKEIGFDEVHYDDIMKAEDIKYGWGYDDCIFYKRVFDYLKQNYPKNSKLFIYLGVASHHLPYKEQNGYSTIRKFNPPANFTEKYLNSYLEQDYCAGEFYEEFKNYNSQTTHLFITPDTSQPLGLHKNNFLSINQGFNDNFLTNLIYAPPASHQKEFKIGSQINEIYSHVDIIPTIFDLLNNKSYPNSFAFAMKNNDGGVTGQYENCQHLVQPYGGGIMAIVKGTDKYLYYISENRLDYYDLKTDWGETKPRTIAQNLSYKDFKEKYYCEKYK